MYHLYPIDNTMRVTPFSIISSKINLKNGLLQTGAIGFGTSETIWASRVPKPPAKIIASMLTSQKVHTLHKHKGNDILAGDILEFYMFLLRGHK